MGHCDTHDFSMKKIILASAVIIPLLAVVVLQGKGKNIRIPPPKILVIGIDGASWEPMKLLLKEGKLPNISNMIEKGSSASLKSMAPAHSPVLWTSIATGKIPSKHGIDHYVTKQNSTIAPVSTTDRKASAFWNILGRGGIRTGVVNWWNSWPPEEINGYMVSDRFRISNEEERSVSPGQLSRELPQVLQSEEQFIDEMKHLGLADSIRFTSGVRSRDEAVQTFQNDWIHEKGVLEISQYLMLNEPVDVFAVMFRSVHLSSHLVWSNMEQDIPQQIRARLRRGRTISTSERERLQSDFVRLIRPVYSYIDHVLGILLEYADENTTVIVCSGHGFQLEEGARTHVHVTSTSDGILILKGPHIRQDLQLSDASILDITPTILYLSGMPAGEDMDGKILVDAISPGYLQQHPAITVATQETGDAETVKNEPNPYDQERLEEFKTLRYIQ